MFEPVPIQIPDVQGICFIPAKQRINRIIAIIKNSDDFKYKKDINASTLKTEEFKNHTGEFAINWPGDSTNIESGENKPVYTSGARMIFIQDEPKPLNILALYVNLEVTSDYNL